MTAGIFSKPIQDGFGNPFQQALLDQAGDGSGPFNPMPVLADPSGTAPLIGQQAMAASLPVVLASDQGPVVVVLEDDPAPLPVITTGVDLAPSTTSPLSSTPLVLNTLSPSMTPAAGRSAYAWLSGSGSASGYFVYSKDGIDWFQFFAGPVQLGVWSYAPIPNVGSQPIAGQMINLPVPDQNGIRIALVATSLAGNVNIELTQ